MIRDKGGRSLHVFSCDYLIFFRLPPLTYRYIAGSPYFPTFSVIHSTVIYCSCGSHDSLLRIVIIGSGYLLSINWTID